MVDNAVLVILVTGTHERGDGKPVAFMPYKQIPGGLTPDLSNTNDTRVIEYKRSQALREGAIVPLHFEWGDGEAEWIDETGQKCGVESLAEAGDYTKIALHTALKTGYARQLLTNCVDNWKQYKNTNSRAKLLVLAPSIPTANQYLDWLKELGINNARIATSDQPKEAQAAIKKFKKDYQPGDTKAVDVLVTVAMAYEGLDVPAITHLACLTHIRSIPWLEQSWARAARVDRKAGNLKDTGLIFIPDDQLARQCVNKIITEQEAIIREREEKNRNNGNSKNGAIDSKVNQGDNSIIALNSNLTRARASDLSNGISVDYNDTAKIHLAMQNAGLGGISTIKMKNFLDSYNAQQPGETTNEEFMNKESLTPSEELDIMRERIENHVRRYARKNNREEKSMNGEIVKYFGKSRKAMAIEELRQVWAWLQKNYPITD